MSHGKVNLEAIYDDGFHICPDFMANVVIIMKPVASVRNCCTEIKDAGSKRVFKGQSHYGTLYLVPTPIGNLQDMTFRGVQTLKDVDLICAEDTRNTGLLLKHFEIETKQYSFHEHNAYEKIPDLLERLKSGLSLAQVSDAGMPSISDPGHDLVKAAIAEDIPVVALPGASAGITALIASGLAPQPHIFMVFFPVKGSAA